MKNRRIGSSNSHPVYLIYRCMMGMIMLFVLTVILGILLYKDRFDLWNFAISYLGGIHSLSGQENLASYLAFNVGMIVCAMLSHRISQLFHHTRHLHHQRFYRLLFEFCATGYIIMLMPHDVSDTIHSFGAGIVFGSLWLYCIFTLGFLYDVIERWKFFGCHILLQSTVLTYAFMYFTGSGLKQNFQKFAIVGLLINLFVVTRFYYRYYRESPEAEINMGSTSAA